MARYDMMSDFYPSRRRFYRKRSYMNWDSWVRGFWANRRSDAYLVYRRGTRTWDVMAHVGFVSGMWQCLESSRSFVYLARKYNF
jgi:hypothetical protein